ncbi:MAG TPA: hypothetical protein VI754_13675 [Bacteriovoracaceae bacterium]|nr:hypothetical protein [Bacteriovoracaceae bacterium]
MKNFFSLSFVILIALRPSLLMARSDDKSKACQSYVDDIVAIQAQQKTVKSSRILGSTLSELEEKHDRLMNKFIVADGVLKVREKFDGLTASLLLGPADYLKSNHLVAETATSVKKVLVINTLAKLLLDRKGQSYWASANEFYKQVNELCQDSAKKTQLENSELFCPIFTDATNDDIQSTAKGFYQAWHDGHLADKEMGPLESITKNYDSKNIAEIVAIYNSIGDKKLDQQTLDKIADILRKKPQSNDNFTLKKNLFDATYGNSENVINYLEQSKQDKTSTPALAPFEKKIMDGFFVASFNNRLMDATQLGQIKNIDDILKNILDNKRLNCQNKELLLSCLQEITPQQKNELANTADKLKNDLKKIQDKIVSIRTSSEYKKLNRAKNSIYNFLKKNCTDGVKEKKVSVIVECVGADGIRSLQQSSAIALVDDANNILASLENQKDTGDMQELCKEENLKKLNSCDHIEAMTIATYNETGKLMRVQRPTEQAERLAEISKGYYIDCNRKGKCKQSYERRPTGGEMFAAALAGGMPAVATAFGQLTANNYTTGALIPQAMFLKQQFHTQEEQQRLAMEFWDSMPFASYPYGYNPLWSGQFNWGNSATSSQSGYFNFSGQ